jgi:Domain of unknown function (DUF3291)
MHLAQINISTLLADMNSPLIADFKNNITQMNALAESSEGFVWRMKDEDSDNATLIQAFENPLIIVNMSVWESAEMLKNYAYKSEHVQFVRRRNEWFEPHQGAYMAMWWIIEGHIPTIEEAKEKLALLNEKGETAEAFTFRYLAKP